MYHLMQRERERGQLRGESLITNTDQMRAEDRGMSDVAHVENVEQEVEIFFPKMPSKLGYVLCCTIQILRYINF